MFISKNLLVFFTTVQEGSLTNAAVKLFTTPPPMSRSLKILEEELGFKLFTRTTSGLKLTLEGAAFYQEIYPTYVRLTEITKNYKKNKNGIINIATYQLNSDHAGVICDYFIKKGNFNIELRENIGDISQMDIVISTKEIKGYDFDTELTASCEIKLLYASHLNDLPDRVEYLKKLPFIQSSVFCSSCCFKRFSHNLIQQGYSGNVLRIDDARVRHEIIKKGAGISLSTNYFFDKKKISHSTEISFISDINLDITYYIYFKSSVINKEFFIQYITNNSLLQWQKAEKKH
ncbi:bacterial regulatory helix-turn-helix, lysR family protein [Yersinia pseudotuberculosis]|uniref:LysR family transcriptional regulator n=1 Tax=Yersinia pseudotuberculosis TaxID=633 RepID=UPI00059AC072|nr:LysR family transcriptional regulator [Yersinia pseudotuberculosis]CQD57655.1 LysR family transcriptional regulator [Yersinia intermedia]AJJ04518.1 bacterial regulatory helix-turn-helix, lysR family protein [Yersinia pseudotuberculosis]AJJ66715.1 bacterial regulatory helix-turn-helix, lysR family protein [Yersinia pseudotuberculosis PB1/+]AYX16753.1 LysR family transcriptional regulator [Yersinia pseudotuberculosis]MBO1606188.1 LysR family transcriptional regulator [Yersinia pseudotuberculo